jgi:hypothetical protein
MNHLTCSNSLFGIPANVENSQNTEALNLNKMNVQDTGNSNQELNQAASQNS